MHVHVHVLFACNNRIVFVIVVNITCVVVCTLTIVSHSFPSGSECCLAR